MPHNLRRVISGPGFIGEIDGLRFMAIMPVVLQHFSERLLKVSPVHSSGDFVLSRIFAHGHIGVYVFFAISGFILSLPFGRQALHTGRPVSLRTYYIRRFTRIEPPYLLVMTLFFLILVFLKHQDFSTLLPHYIASCLYVHRIVYGEWSPINPPSWTLEVEVQFYIVAPILTLFYFSIRNRWLRRLLLVSLILVKIIIANTTTLFDNLNITLPYMVEFFLVGVLLADIYIADWKDGIPQSRFYDFVTIISIIVMFCSWTWDKNLSWKFIFITALFTTFYGCFRSISVNKFFKSPWISAIGGMCYSIYLLHLAFAEFFTSAYSHFLPSSSYAINYLVGLLLFLPAVFMISVIFYLVIEKPCMDPQWPQKAWYRLRTLSLRTTN
ncbi:acyltransferase family protein [Spirosoma litoris]